MILQHNLDKGLIIAIFGFGKKQTIMPMLG